MSRLDLLDPTSADDPRFDPHGAQARRVRAAAVARAEASPQTGSPRRRWRRLALAGGAVAALAVAAVIVGTTGSPSDARAVLRDAAARTAAIESGRVIWTQRWNVPSKRLRGAYREEIRFDGEDLESVVRGRDVNRGRTYLARSTFREVDGVGYTRDDSRPGARFVREPFQISDQDPTHLIVEQVGSVALVDLARRSNDLTTERESDGGVTYRATTTSGAVFDAAPRAAGRMRGPAWARAVRLEIGVGPDGLIRRVRTSSDIETTVTEYLDLGEPQRIEPPVDPAESEIEPPPDLREP